MKFNKAVKITGVCALVMSIAACSSSSNTTEQVVDAKETYGCNVINVFSPGEYIDENVIPDFEKMYNATVTYTLFDSNEQMYTKLQGTNKYDVLVPSDYMIEQLMEENFLQPVDQEKMTNSELLDPDVVEMQKVFDPNLEYAVPYFWGSVGLVYNKTKVDEAVIKEQGWNILHNTDYKGKFYFYDSQRDAFMIAFKALGYSMNTEDDAEIQTAYEWLQEMNETMEPAYVTDEVIDSMISGNKDIAVMYSGDATYVLSENEDMAWIEPDQGTNLWIDAMVIPSNAECAPLANEFINYIISEDVQTKNSEYVGYTSVDKAVAEAVGSDTYEGISAYTPRTGYAKDEVFHYNSYLKQKLSDLYIKVKNKN